jgi:hypothetical protein
LAVRGVMSSLYLRQGLLSCFSSWLGESDRFG